MESSTEELIEFNMVRLSDGMVGYSMFAPLSYLNCKLSYLECLGSKDPKSCFDKHGYEIMEKCNTFMNKNPNPNIYIIIISVTDIILIYILIIIGMPKNIFLPIGLCICVYIVVSDG